MICEYASLILCSVFVRSAAVLGIYAYLVDRAHLPLSSRTALVLRAFKGLPEYESFSECAYMDTPSPPFISPLPPLPPSLYL
ncbi:hypothetical protein BDQ17DRAFT_1384603, partial [Cyathus striatus]